MARITVEDCLMQGYSRFMLVHATARRVRQIRQGSPHLVDTPENEDIVIALREIAAGKVNIEGSGTFLQQNKGITETTRPQEQRPTTKESQAGAMKKGAKGPVSEKARPKATGIEKEYFSDGIMCKVTFRLPHVVATDAKGVCIVGDFNNWDIHANSMKRQRSGDFDISLELESGREYQYRYLIDESTWENDCHADKYVKSPYGDSDNSVIIL